MGSFESVVTTRFASVKYFFATPCRSSGESDSYTRYRLFRVSKERS
jgi:hypothetical protein